VTWSAPGRASAAVAALTLLLGVTACTADSPPDRSAPTGRTSASSAPTSSTSPRPASAPLRVAVTRVSGKLSAHDRTVLAANVGRVIGGYLDAAFLRGPYPRSDFSDSFGAFTRGAARTARRDQALLTNRGLGPSTASVRAVRRTAYLSVLAPFEVAAGVTANVALDLVVRRSSGPPQRVRMSGRLLLTRDDRGGWSIFGYDLSRSDTAARSTS
jgi:hypothetical protein